LAACSLVKAAFSNRPDVALLQKEHQIWRNPKQVEAGHPWRMPVEAGIPVGLLSGWGLMPSGGDAEDTMPVEAGISVGLLSGWQPWPAHQKSKIVFGVFTSPVPKYAEQMQAVAETWAREVLEELHQKLLVVGVRGTIPGVAYKLAPQCPEGHSDNYGISCKEASLLSTGYELGTDWLVLKSGRLSVGYNSTLKSLRSGDSKLVIISNNCPPGRKSELEYFAMLSKIGVHHFSGNNIDLGSICGKFFRISSLSITDPGDSDIITKV
jgi:large subunit ribosomal protein L30e